MLFSIMTSDLLIRCATPDDAPTLWALQQAAFLPLSLHLPSRPTALDEDEHCWRTLIGQAPGQVAIGLLQGQAVVAGRFDGGPPVGELKRIAVHPAWQSQGFGRLLVLALEEHARQFGFSQLRAGTRRRLPGNQAFYQRLGYRQTGIEPYPAGIDDDTVWLEKRL